MKKDIYTNNLIECADVFADIANVNLLSEQMQIHDFELEDLKTDFSYRELDGEPRKLFRDTFKKVKKDDYYIAMIGYESQTGICNTMPVRDMGYNYVAYQDQIHRIVAQNRKDKREAYSKVIHDDQKLLPVLTVVLYFGKEEWKSPLSLMDILKIPKGQETFWENEIQNHRIHVIPMLHQPEELRKKYQSDFRIVADYLACYDTDKENIMRQLRKDNQKLIHVEQTLDMLSAFSGDNRFKEIKSYYENMNDEEKGERNTMCILLDAVEEEGVKKGIERGIEQGIEQVTMTMIQKQISDNEIISLTGITEEKLAALKKQIGI